MELKLWASVELLGTAGYDMEAIPDFEEFSVWVPESERKTGINWTIKDKEINERMM